MAVVNVNHWANIVLAQGHTDSNPAGGNAAYIQNHGPNRLQVLYVDALAVSAEEAGLETVESVAES